MRSGVRCAETILTSWGTPSSSRTSAAPFIVGQSDWLPITMPTNGSLMSSLPRTMQESRHHSGRDLGDKTGLGSVEQRAVPDRGEAHGPLGLWHFMVQTPPMPRLYEDINDAPARGAVRRSPAALRALIPGRLLADPTAITQNAPGPIGRRR